jgi:Lon protease-like protein
MSSAELAVVSIFPLPQVALFPHAILPLHVFEPRYREMVRDCLAGDRKMAVASLAPGYEATYHERPAVRAVCGVGELVAHEALADGRSNILLRARRAAASSTSCRRARATAACAGSPSTIGCRPASTDRARWRQ